MAASSAAQILVSSPSIDWNSPRGDLIKRAYWHCFLIEWFGFVCIFLFNSFLL